MQSLKRQINKLKESFQTKREDHLQLERTLQGILRKTFPGIDAGKHLKQWFIKDQTLFLEAANKAFAQELFWRRSEILKKIGYTADKIRKIVIR